MPRAKKAEEPTSDEPTPTPEETPEPVVEPAEDEPGAEPDAEPVAEPGSDPITESPPEAPGTPALDAETAAASPLAPPVPPPTAVAPQPGDSAAAPVNATRTAPGPHMRLEDDDGAEVEPDDLFWPQQGPSTLLTVKRRVYQVFRYPGTSTPTRQLLLNGGTTMPIPRAMQIVNEIKAVAAENAEKVGAEQAAV